jgi:amino acid transporter
MFCSSRALHMLALEGQAPRIFARTNRRGTPYMAVGAIALGGCLSYLSMSQNSAKGTSPSRDRSRAHVPVLVWFTNLTTACTLMSWIVIGWRVGSYIGAHALT